MKFLIVIPAYIRGDFGQREAWARKAYTSLDTTNPILHAPVEVASICADDLSLELVQKLNPEFFQVKAIKQPEYIGGVDQAICWLLEQIILKTDFTHMVWFMDDMIVNPRWMWELSSLIYRHPNALGWSVYRSGHQRHHRTIIQDENGDHQVTALCGNGMCITKEEWIEWGVKSSDGQAWPIPWDFNGGGDTLDLFHAYKRPGERWATDRSFMTTIGTVGRHATNVPTDVGMNFVGE